MPHTKYSYVYHFKLNSYLMLIMIIKEKLHKKSSIYAIKNYLKLNYTKCIKNKNIIIFALVFNKNLPLITDNCSIKKKVLTI